MAVEAGGDPASSEKRGCVVPIRVSFDGVKQPAERGISCLFFFSSTLYGGRYSYQHPRNGVSLAEPGDIPGLPHTPT